MVENLVFSMETLQGVLGRRENGVKVQGAGSMGPKRQGRDTFQRERGVGDPPLPRVSVWSNC